MVLQFPFLEEDVYRIEVSDNITDVNGNRLDGDQNGIPGGIWSGDFVVNIPNHNLEPISRTPFFAPNASASIGWGERTVSGDGRFITFLSGGSNLVPGDVNGLVDVFWKDLLLNETRLVSTSTSGVQANHDNFHASISGDGRYVVFQSWSDNLIDGTTTPRFQIYRKDMLTGAIDVVSSSATGTPAVNGAIYPMVSQDGRFVAFSSSDRQLVPGDSNNVSDIFLKDMVTGSITLASVTATGGQGNAQSNYSYLSNNGMFIAFMSSASNFDPADSNTSEDVYFKNLITGELRVVSVNNSGVVSNGFSEAPFVSDDGQKVVFSSVGTNLVNDDGNGDMDVFLRDLIDGTTQLVSRTAAGIPADRGGRWGALDPTGRYVSFLSISNDLVPGDNNQGLSDIFIKDLQTGEVSILTTDPSGNPASEVTDQLYSPVPSWSQDGRYLVFHHYSNLVDPYQATSSIYRKDMMTGDIELASTRLDMLPNFTGSSDSNEAAINADGQFVAFSSNANNLTLNDTNTFQDIFIMNRQLGLNELVSVTPDGIAANGTSNSPSLSRDARFVAFVSQATNLVANDTNNSHDIFVKDRSNGSVMRANTLPNGQVSNGSAGLPFLSGDGSRMAFASNAFDLYAGDNNSQSDVFVKDLVGGGVTIVSATASGLVGNGMSTNPIMSEDGRYVLFRSMASNLVPGDNNGTWDLFVKDLLSNAIVCVSQTPIGQTANGQSASGWISPDGRWVAFSSSASDLVPNDVNNQTDVFLRDLLTGNITLVSQSSTGGAADRGADYPSISRDGQFVSFWSFSTNLQATPVFSRDHFYVKNIATGELTRQTPVMPNNLSYHAFFSVLSADGSTLAFESTNGRMVGGDYNGVRDIYTTDVASPSQLSLRDPANTSFAIDTKGIGSGSILEGPQGAFDMYSRLQVNGFDLLSMTRPTLTQAGSTVSIPAFNLGQFTVDRQIYVPPTGTSRFARIVDTYTNTSPGNANATVSYFGNLGSDEQTIVFATSDGDLIVEPTDTWLGTDDAIDNGGTPAVIHLLHGPLGFVPDVTMVEDNIQWTYSVPLAAGATARLASFAIVTPRRSDAVATVNRLFSAQGFDPQAIANMSELEVNSLANFQFDTPRLELTATLNQFREDAGANATTMTLRRTGSLDTPLTVQLSNSDTTEVSWPASVTFAANQDTLQIPVDAVDDTLLDGLQLVTLGASAVGFNNPQVVLSVLDAESLRITSSRSSVFENAGPQAAILTIERSNTDISLPLTVGLFGSDNSEGTVPVSVTIPANAASTTVFLAAVDDTILDGPQGLSLIALRAGYDAGQTDVIVLDFEQVQLAFDRTSIFENAGANAAILTATRTNTDRSEAVTVTLFNPDTSEISVPNTLVIPANAASASIAIGAVDDGLFDGTQIVQVTSLVPGYELGNAIISVLDVEPLGVSMSHSSIREDAGASTVQLTLSRPSSNNGTNLTVFLTSSDTSELTLPASVTIPVGQNQVVVPVTIVDDALLDGPQSVTIQITATGYDNGSTPFTVLDAEALTAVFDRTSIRENDGSNAATLTVTRSNTDRSQALVVQINNGDATELSVPGVVTIPANAASVQVPVAAVDDTLLDGTLNVTVLANATGYDFGLVRMDVLDAEFLTLSSTQTSIREDAGPNAAIVTVTRSNTDLGQAVTVNLSTSDSTELQLPSTVTIPIGQPSQTFSVNAVDDTLLDGLQVVLVSASATGYDTGNRAFNVLDVESLGVSLDRSSIAENAGSNAAILTIRRPSGDLSTPLNVSITSSDLTEATLVTTATIPVNQTEVQLPIQAVDDALLDGSQTVVLSAVATGFETSNINLTVADAELLTLSANQTSVREDAGPQSVLFTLSRSNTDTQAPITVTLNNSRPSEVTVPGSVTIPANQASVTFLMDVLDDTLLDGNKTVALTVAHPAYGSGTASIDVLDVEELSIQSNDLSVREDAGVGGVLLTIRRQNTDIGSPITLNLSSSLPAEVSVPATVTIPANSQEVTVAVDVIDDNLLEGLEFVDIVATGASYEAGTLRLSVLDVERLSLTLNRSVINENAGSGAATLTVRRLNTNLAQPVTIGLSVSLPGAVTIPLQVTIPANQAQQTVSLEAIDDNLLDGSQQVTIFADGAGYDQASVVISVEDVENLLLSTDVTQALEQGGRIQLTITRGNTDWNTTILVGLVSSDISEANVPGTVTIPAGVESVTVPITAVDDSLLDGTQTLQITANALGYVASQMQVAILDAETLSVSLDRASYRENAGNQVAVVTVTRSNSDLDRAVNVSIGNSDPSEGSTPSSIAIPAGQSSVSFFLNAVDDALLDGTQTLSVSASANGYLPGSSSIQSLDVETLQVQFSVMTIPENAGSGQVALTVRRSNTDRSLPLTVGLQNDDLSELSVPATIEIPANSDSVSVLVGVVDDTLKDGSQLAKITANASGYESGSATITVTDVETLSLIADVLQYREDAGENAGTVRLTRSNTDLENPLNVQLFSSDRSEATLPTTFVIPAGQASVTIPLSIVDDNLLDGVQQVELRATAIGYVESKQVIDVSDKEQLAISLSKSVVSETSGANATTLTIRRPNTDRSSPLTVQLLRDDDSELELPPSIEIPANAAFVQVPIAAKDDALLDGTQVVSITASATGYLSSDVTASVTDSEALSLSVNKATIRENDGPMAFQLTVQRSNTDWGAPLEVTIASDLANYLALPATLTIPANSGSHTIGIDAIDNSLLEGLKSGSISVSATGYTGASLPMSINDAESLALELDVAEISENGGRAVARLRRSNTDTSSALSVNVTSTSTSRITYSSIAIIPAGQQETTFVIDAVDDRLLQGTTAMDISVAKSGYESAKATLRLLDQEEVTIRLEKPDIAENRGTTNLIVTRSDTATPQALTVTIAYDKLSLLTAPSSVVIPANQASVSVPVTAIDDFLFDGDEVVLITATATGYQGANGSLRIIDEETKKPGTNPRLTLDVNNDGFISPLDSLLILNRLNLGGTIPLTEFGRFYDTSGDLIVSPLDALRVINYLNLFGTTQGEGDGEGLVTASDTPLADSQAILIEPESTDPAKQRQKRQQR